MMLSEAHLRKGSLITWSFLNFNNKTVFGIITSIGQVRRTGNVRAVSVLWSDGTKNMYVMSTDSIKMKHPSGWSVLVF